LGAPGIQRLIANEAHPFKSCFAFRINSHISVILRAIAKPEIRLLVIQPIVISMVYFLTINRSHYDSVH